MDRPRATDVLVLEEQKAWSEYLDTVVDQPETRYEEIEPWAWKRLNHKLLAIQTRRRAIESEDGA